MRQNHLITILNSNRGIRLETLVDIKKYRSKIMKQSVLTKAMPLGNKSGMTEKERKGVGDWIKRGMP